MVASKVNDYLQTQLGTCFIIFANVFISRPY